MKKKKGYIIRMHAEKKSVFDKNTGEINFTGRQVFVKGVDGFVM